MSCAVATLEDSTSSSSSTSRSSSNSSSDDGLACDSITFFVVLHGARPSDHRLVECGKSCSKVVSQSGRKLVEHYKNECRYHAFRWHTRSQGGIQHVELEHPPGPCCFAQFAARFQLAMCCTPSANGHLVPIGTLGQYASESDRSLLKMNRMKRPDRGTLQMDATQHESAKCGPCSHGRSMLTVSRSTSAQNSWQTSYRDS